MPTIKHAKSKRKKKKTHKKYAYNLSSARYSRYKSLQAVNKEGNNLLKTSIILSQFIDIFFKKKIKCKGKLIWKEK